MTYLHDTWAPQDSTASWYFDLSRVTRWPDDAVRRLYRALPDSARVIAVRIESGDFVPGHAYELTPGNPVSEEEAVAHAAAFPGEIGTLAFDLELRVWIRTAENGLPKLAWVGDRTEATLTPPASGRAPFACLNLHHTLFSPRSPRQIDNYELYRLNAPVLAGFLQRLQDQLGPMAEFEGGGVTATGFQPFAPEEPQ